MSGKDTGALKSAGFWGRLELWKKIVVGMVLGCIVGVVMGRMLSYLNLLVPCLSMPSRC